MNELNKKLAEWRGFSVENISHGVYPNFTQSLNACEKWLFPKLYEQGYYYNLLQWNEGQHKAIINKRTAEWVVTASDAVAETPALTFCLAVEKIIDGGK